ncbi:MAG: Sec-independent protein translocase protein TatB [Gammaproteobacteria bacterium]|nr:Sec-independent protein translocase protein TatB [Gammaproteobacteria bacterium]
MFDFSFWELAIVLVVALLVVGPDKLPGLAVKIGRWVGKGKRMMMSVRSDIESELKAAELKDMLDKQQSEISQLRNILNDTQTDTQQEIQKAIDSSDAEQAKITNHTD